MAEITLYKQDASEAGKVELSDRVFAAKVNQTLLYQSVNSTLANRRRGTQSAKTRGEVSGGGAKPWKQKGTGRARQGSIRAIQWKGGGVAFAPKPRDYSFKLPAKARKAALRSALTDTLSSNKLTVIDSFDFSEIKTQIAVATLKGLGFQDKKVMLISDTLTDTTKKSLQNIPKVCYGTSEQLTPYDLLWADKVLVTKAALAKIEEGLK